MKKTVRLVALLLIAAMCVGMFAACGGKDPKPAESTGTTGTSDPAKVNAFGWEVPEETLTIKISNLVGGYAPDENDKRGLENMQAYLLKEFNVDLQVEMTTGDGSEAQNLALASGEYGDVVTGISYATAQKFRDQGRAVDLAPYMDTVGASVKKVMGDVYIMLEEDDGALYMLPRSMGAVEELPDLCAAVRYDEYLEIGEPKIETPEDYYNAMKQILELHPTNSLGEKRYALSLYDFDYPTVLGGYWGLKEGWDISEDNQFTYWAFTDAGYEMTKWFNQLHRDGNLDPDAFINTFEDWGTKCANERLVGNIGYWWTVYNKGHEVWQKNDPNWNENKRYIHLGFKSENADQAYITGKNHLGYSYTMITDKAKDPEAIMKFINFMGSEKGMALFNWGIPGGVEDMDGSGRIIKNWDLHEDGTWEFDAEAKKSFLDNTWDYSKEKQLGGTSNQLYLFRTNSRWEDGVHCIWPNQCWYEENPWKQMMIENLQGTIFDSTPLVVLERTPEFSMLENSVKDAWGQFWPACVQAKSDAELEKNWKALQDGLTAAGVEQYTEQMQANYLKNIGQ